MPESDEVAQAKIRLLELESKRMSEGDMREWRRLHRVIWGEEVEPQAFMVSANLGDKLLFETGLSLDEALKLARAQLRNGTVAVTIQHLERG